MKALIALEDGAVFEGRSFVGPGETQGELVFNTAMTGYQEILTDPSYNGQIVTLTYPLIGNYGLNAEDVESDRPFVKGLIIGECSRIASNWRSTETLPDYLKANGILGIDRVDCRAITLHIRSKGAMRCVISTEELDSKRLVQRAKESPGLIGRDLVTEVSTKTPYIFEGSEKGSRKIAVLDCGIKTNQLRLLREHDCQLHVFPNTLKADELLALKPDGFFLSNGPGDPEALPHLVAELRKVISTGLPTFGICFGHQLLALALGGKTFKMKFGHRGGNQPVIELATGRVDITSQNHGFAVDIDSLPSEVETTHLNLNDRTSEGQRHKKLPIVSVQYHPEAAPGPTDAMRLFDQFVEMVDKA
ncbi:MAG: glutamine-hydrolyzing carbamoyl-phosphate synthase small subunit [Kiritimatiellae bacterium]|nr:glutamine-hydrolyzing carbamoyl-phosphate synthase small subunit [Kiritimatiellia bacterium]MCO5060443.1 glutamine-hydrolyzing carbamoyl-phosphate synthase small subunit [Kiritimatiellia bacterium]MCO5068041.1 glutamine-hydrolyzing carbamoyl-phosphate synthase small subunit [Kiritimatiellia bacterium]MCO6400237.1 glutamine-hydrolyzing carbamoyl-phosphate synthase small subunit [Verrucomicrobiota bacterium]